MKTMNLLISMIQDILMSIAIECQESGSFQCLMKGTYIAVKK